MSKLSELLPTGGGQNAVDFVASGTLSSGQTVALKADGTVEAVSGVTEGIGSETSFAGGTITYVKGVYDANAGKVVLIYRNNSSSGNGGGSGRQDKDSQYTGGGYDSSKNVSGK